MSDLIQVTCYQVLGAMVVQVVGSTTSESGREWTMLMQEQVEMKHSDGSDWDAIWLIARAIAQRAAERSSQPHIEV